MLWKGDEGQTTQDGCDTLRLANVGGEMVCRDGGEGYGGEGEVEEGGIGVFSVRLEGAEAGEGRVREIVVARGDDAVQPGLGEPAPARRAVLQ